MGYQVEFVTLFYAIEILLDEMHKEVKAPSSVSSNHTRHILFYFWGFAPLVCRMCGRSHGISFLK